jgi:hypothetical protein
MFGEVALSKVPSKFLTFFLIDWVTDLARFTFSDLNFVYKLINRRLGYAE